MNVNGDTSLFKKEESPDKDEDNQPMEEATEPKPPKDANAEKSVDDEPLSEMEPPTAEPSEEPQSEIPGPTPKQFIDLPGYLIDVKSNLTIEERDKIVLRLKEDFPKGKGITYIHLKNSI